MRLDTNLLRYAILKYPDSPVHTLLGIYFFLLWRTELQLSGFAVEFAGCMWTEAVSEKKKLRIQKYQDTCGRNLRFSLFLKNIEQLMGILWGLFVGFSVHNQSSYFPLSFKSISDSVTLLSCQNSSSRPLAQWPTSRGHLKLSTFVAPHKPMGFILI